jgi:hypothetical protein
MEQQKSALQRALEQRYHVRPFGEDGGLSVDCVSVSTDDAAGDVLADAVETVLNNWAMLRAVVAEMRGLQVSRLRSVPVIYWPRVPYVHGTE